MDFSLLLMTFSTVFIAEMGDKTQLLLVAMAGKYKVRDILAGTWLATFVLNFLAVAVGAALSNYLDMRIIKTIAALAFFYFSWSTLKEINDSEEEEFKNSSTNAAVIAIFAAFFLGELGDKTQLSAITLAAAYTNHLIGNAILVFAGCTAGLILADLIGLLAGLFMKSKMPTKLLNIISILIFAVFGILNIYQAGTFIFPENKFNGIILSASVSFVFALACVATILIQKKKEGKKIQEEDN